MRLCCVVRSLLGHQRADFPGAVAPCAAVQVIQLLAEAAGRIQPNVGELFSVLKASRVLLVGCGWSVLLGWFCSVTDWSCDAEACGAWHLHVRIPGYGAAVHMVQSPI